MQYNNSNHLSGARDLPQETSGGGRIVRRILKSPTRRTNTTNPTTVVAVDQMSDPSALHRRPTTAAAAATATIALLSREGEGEEGTDAEDGLAAESVGENVSEERHGRQSARTSRMWILALNCIGGVSLCRLSYSYYCTVQFVVVAVCVWFVTKQISTTPFCFYLSFFFLFSVFQKYDHIEACTTPHSAAPVRSSSLVALSVWSRYFARLRLHQ